MYIVGGIDWWYFFLFFYPKLNYLFFSFKTSLSYFAIPNLVIFFSVQTLVIFFHSKPCYHISKTSLFSINLVFSKFLVCFLLSCFLLSISLIRVSWLLQFNSLLCIFYGCWFLFYRPCCYSVQTFCYLLLVGSIVLSFSIPFFFQFTSF